MGEPKWRCSFKNIGKDLDEMRRRREELISVLRKQNREEIIEKRRAAFIDDDEEEFHYFKSIEDISRGLTNVSNPDTQASALKTICWMMQDQKLPNSSLVNAKMVPQLVAMLDYFAYPQIQLQACWVLTDLASDRTENTLPIIKAGGLEKLLGLITVDDLELKEQSVWAIGNIAADHVENRNQILNSNFLKSLLSEFDRKDCSVSFLRQASWVLTILFQRCYPSVPSCYIKDVIPLVEKLLSIEEPVLRKNACEVTSHITDTWRDEITPLISRSLISAIVRLLSTEDILVLSPAIETLGNMLCHEGNFAEMIYQEGFLTKLVAVLECSNFKVCQYGVWSLGNLIIGGPSRVEAMFEAGLGKSLVQLLKSHHLEVQKEALIATLNAAKVGGVQAAEKLVLVGVVGPLCDLLVMPDPEMVMTALECCNMLLECARRAGKLASLQNLVESVGGLSRIESLQHHSNPDIYRSSYAIIDKFFSTNEE